MAKVTVLWNGGWDDYEVDIDSIRDMTESEIAKDKTGNNKYFPTFSAPDGEMLKGKFLDHSRSITISASQCVKVTAHLGGGD